MNFNVRKGGVLSGSSFKNDPELVVVPDLRLSVRLFGESWAKSQSRMGSPLRRFGFTSSDLHPDGSMVGAQVIKERVGAAFG